MNWFSNKTFHFLKQFFSLFFLHRTVFCVRISGRKIIPIEEIDSTNYIKHFELHRVNYKTLQPSQPVHFPLNPYFNYLPSINPYKKKIQAFCRIQVPSYLTSYYSSHVKNYHNNEKIVCGIRLHSCNAYYMVKQCNVNKWGIATIVTLIKL